MKNKKVLLFTHKVDIDGLGCAVLAKLAFSNVEYVLCEYPQFEILKFFNSGRIYDYDLVFVTDMWPGNKVLDRVLSDERLCQKFFVFDHHDISLSKMKPEYDFVTVRISDKKGACSGASLYYEHLVNNNIIKSSNSLDRFINLTRYYDTAEWRDDNLIDADRLNTLFEMLGRDKYIDSMYAKLSQYKDSLDTFRFDAIEDAVIESGSAYRDKIVDGYVSCIVYGKFRNRWRTGIVFADFIHRNPVSDRLRYGGYDIDIGIIITIERQLISYRSMKPDIDINEIAGVFGGSSNCSSKATSSFGNSGAMGLVGLLSNNELEIYLS